MSENNRGTARTRLCGALLSGAGIVAMGSAGAGEVVTTQQLPPELQQLINAIMTQPQASPGVVFGSPVAFGARSGDWFAGLNGSTSDTRNDFIGDIDVDGSGVVGMGFGNPDENIGVELGLNIISLTDEFADSGALAAKLHRNIGDRGAIAIGTENSLAWGEAEDVADAVGTTEFISYSHYFNAGGKGLMLTVGAGDGRLGSKDDPEDVAMFAALGYAFTSQLSAILDYSGETTNVGLSFVPWTDTPFTVLIGATDLSEERGDTEFAVSVGYSGSY